VEWERERQAFRAARAGTVSQPPGAGRILETAEAVQQDWLMTSAALKTQGLLADLPATWSNSGRSGQCSCSHVGAWIGLRCSSN
jgi:hypothetical protein